MLLPKLPKDAINYEPSQKSQKYPQPGNSQFMVFLGSLFADKVFSIRTTQMAIIPHYGGACIVYTSVCVIGLS
jgi:hypothetical protein